MKKTVNHFRPGTNILLFLIAAFSLTGCTKVASKITETLTEITRKNTVDEKKAVRLGAETTYYNDYLGISYTIPKGWWVYSTNKYNIGKSKGEIVDYVSLDVSFNEFDDQAYSNIWLMSFGNLEESKLDNHLGFSLEARSVEGVSNFADYMKYFEAYMLEPTENEEYKLLDMQKLSIREKAFEIRDYLVSRDAEDYKILTLNCELKEGYYLNIYVDYWPSNTKAERSIIDSISNAINFYFP